MAVNSFNALFLLVPTHPNHHGKTWNSRYQRSSYKVLTENGHFKKHYIWCKTWSNHNVKSKHSVDVELNEQPIRNKYRPSSFSQVDLLHGHNTDRAAKAMYKFMIITENDTDQVQYSSIYYSSNSGSGSIKLPIAVHMAVAVVLYTNCWW